MLYGVEQTVTYIAWDTSANAGKTGDSANHTLRWVKNGTSAAPTNTPSEVDATNAPGLYKITLTATEWETLQGTLAGKSSTANVSVIPQQFTTVRGPNAAPGASGGLPILGTGTGAINPSGGKLPATLAAADVSGNLPADAKAWNGGSLPTIGTLTQADIRTAVGLGSANLDTQLGDLPTVSEFEARTLLAADYFVVGDYTAPPSSEA
jgi:hypothetical protein